MKYTFNQLKVSQILLDIKNPRFPEVKNQREAIKAMLDDQGDKLYQLAKDIVENGLDPSKRLIVFKQEGVLVDGDGNRRLTALKILETPNLISNQAIRSKFTKLSNDYTPINLIDCVVFASRESCKHWIKINHDGLQGGRGQDPWTPEQKERFSGKKSASVCAMDLLLQLGRINADEKKEVQKTTFDRVLNSSSGKTVMSIRKDGHRFEFNDIDRLHATFIALKGQKVELVYRKEKIDSFLYKVHGTLKGKKFIPKGGKRNIPKKKKKTRRSNKKDILFGGILKLKEGEVNDMYRDICDIYELGESANRYAEILGMSMRLLLDVAAHEYFAANPSQKKSRNNEYAEYIKIIKGLCTAKGKNTISVDPSITILIQESNMEAFLPKLAHGVAHCSRAAVLTLSLIIGPILTIHFSEKAL